MKLTAVFLAGFILICFFGDGSGIASGGQSPNRSKIITKFQRWVTTYITTAQYNTFLNKIEPKMGPNMTTEEVTNALISAVTATLTGVQYMQLASYGLSFIAKYPNYNIPIDIISSILVNNLWPVGTQLADIMVRCGDKGMTDANTWKRLYTKVDQFMTDKRCHTIWCRVYTGFNSNDTTLWPIITGTLKSCFLYNVYPLTACDSWLA